MKILLVEDTPEILDFLASYFAREGWEVVEAQSAEEGWQRFLEVGERLDLIFTDGHLPGKSGVWLAEEISKTSDVPVIFSTADKKSWQSSLDGGLFEAVLEKPFSISSLREAIQKCVGLKIDP